MTKILSALDGIPQGLKGYYVRILQRIAQDRQETAARILNILLSTQRSLTDGELAVAFLYASRPSNYTKHSDFEREILIYISGYAKRVCSSLVKVTGEHIEIVHQSARAFLLNLSSNPRYTFLSAFYHYPVTGHNLMSRICLEYLLLEDFRQVDRSFGLRNRHPFLAYAGKYWPYHIRESKEHLMECRLLLRRFLKKESPNFLFWIRSLSFLTVESFFATL